MKRMMLSRETSIRWAAQKWRTEYAEVADQPLPEKLAHLPTVDSREALGDQHPRPKAGYGYQVLQRQEARPAAARHDRPA